MSIESRCTIGAMASKKASASSPVSLRDRLGERGRGEGAGGDDDAVPVRGRQAATSSRRISISGWACKRRGDGGREAVAIDRQRAAGRHLIGVGGAHDQRAEPAHLLVQQADGVVLAVVGAERVGADELGQRVGLVGRGRAQRAHLVQHDGHAARGDLPGGLASRRGRRR